MKKELPPFLKRAIRIRALEIPPLEKHILHTLNSRCDRAGSCFPSINTLELDTGLARSTIFIHIRSLRKRGYLSCQRFGERNHRNKYSLTLFHEDSLTPSIPDTSHKSGRRTPTSLTPEPTSPADGLLQVRQTYLSSIEEERYKISNEEHLYTNDEEDELQEAWISILEELSNVLPHQIINTWFIQLRPVEWSTEHPRTLTVKAPNKFCYELLIKKYPKLMDVYQFNVQLIKEYSYVSRV